MYTYLHICSSKDGSKSNFRLMVRCRNSYENSQRRNREKRNNQRREKGKEADKSVQKVGKVTRQCVIPMFFVAPGAAEPSGPSGEVSKIARWCEAHVKLKTHYCWRFFESWGAEKVHAAVAQSAFGSQNVQKASALECFCKLRCWKSPHSCSQKRARKSTVLKTDG